MENESNIADERNEPVQSPKWKTLHGQRIFLTRFYFGLTIALLLTLPFHYDLDQLNIFPKENLTFSHTFFRHYEINKMIDEYNNAPLLQKPQISSRPFYRTLMENGYITVTKDTTSNQNN